MGLNQVQVAPFGLIFDRGESYRVQEASGMPPGPQNRPKPQKTLFFGFFWYFPLFSPIGSVAVERSKDTLDYLDA